MTFSPATTFAASNVLVEYDGIPLPANSAGRYELIPGTTVIVLFDSDGLGNEAATEVNDDSETRGSIHPSSRPEYEYEALAPVGKRSGDVTIQIVDGEVKTTLIEATLPTLPVVLDPLGQPAYGGRVTLYTRDELGLWQIWASKESFQKNPRTIGIDGKYAYYVEPGEYRINIQTTDAADFNSSPAKVDRIQILTMAAELDFDDQASSSEFDASIVSIVSALLKQLEDLRKNADIVNITKNVLKPFAYLVAMGAIFGYVLTAILQFGIGFSIVPFLPVHTVQFFMSLFGIRRNRLPWGQVHDFKYSVPIPQASVLLFKENAHKLIQVTTSDLDGNYSFDAEEGRYSLFATKKRYQFPVPGANYVYKGEIFALNTGVTPTYNIAMDFHGEKPDKISLGVVVVRKGVWLVKWLMLVAGALMALWDGIFGGNTFSYAIVVGYFFIMWAQFKRDHRQKTIAYIEGL